MRQVKKKRNTMIVGMDLGGWRLRMGIVQVDGQGNLSLQGEVEERTSPKSWKEFSTVVTEYHKRASASKPEGYGIAIAGAIKCHAKVIKAPNLPWLDGHNVPEELAEPLQLKPEQIVVSNDMEAAAYGKRAKGVLAKYDWAIFDTISTGWGGALILNGEVVVGEPGHVNLGFSLPYVCGCGNVGCVEALYSGSAMERRIRREVEKQFEERKTLFPPDLLQGEKVWDFFHKELETGAEWAVSLLEEWAEGVGRAWANVLNRIRPVEAIVYMGKTAEELVPKAIEHIRATIQRICMFPEHKDPEKPLPIEKATEHNRSIYGAVLVYQKVRTGKGKERRRLFSVAWDELSDALKSLPVTSSQVPDPLRQKFHDQRISLSDDAQIGRLQENEWQITDKDKTYVILKKDDTLTIYGRCDKP